MLKRMLFLRWWLIFTLTVVGTLFSWRVGLLDEIWKQDATKLSFATIAVFYYMSIWCGAKSWSLSGVFDDTNRPVPKLTAAERRAIVEKVSRYGEIGWFASDLCLTLGMLGTVVGFLIMLSGGFGNIDVTNTKNIQGLLNLLGSGMATALYTTAVGLVCGAILKIEYFSLSMVLDQLEEVTANECGKKKVIE